MFSSFFKSSASSVSGLGSSSFDIGAEINLPHSEKHLFRLHEGSLKSNPSNPSLAQISSNELSIFICDNASNIGSFSSAVKRLKTLRHPSIVTYIDCIESDSKITLATEKVVPLSVHLDQLDEKGIRGAPRDHYIAWGIFQILRGLAFLNIDAKLRHNSLHGDSIFVTKSGDWKLFALDRVTTIADDNDNLPISTLPALQKYDSPEVSDSSKRRQMSPWARDMWGVGCVIWEVFNGPLPNAKNLGQLGSIPKKLSTLYMELVATNPSKRPNPKQKIEQLRRGTGYFKNDLIDTILFLEELHLKDETSKGRFYSSLSPMVDDFPDHVGSYKILPELIKAFEFGNAGAAILNPVFKLGSKLESEEYVKVIVPCLVKLFASNDRNARYKLLNQIELFVDYLSDKLANEEVFSHIQHGFSDQEPMIREKTVIAMIHLAPKLSYSNLDECIVMKHFARLLRDEQSGIRTNTTVCLGKIARYLHYGTRQKVLINAFTAKLRDPFPPARIAAINALAATQQYFTIQETSGKVLPALCQTLTDPEEPVRAQAFKVTNGFIAKLEQVSKNPELKEEMEAEITSTASNKSSSSVAGWASWAVGAIGAKFYKSNVSSKPTEQSNSKSSESTDITSSSSISRNVEPNATNPTTNNYNDSKVESKFEELNVNDASENNETGDGWDDAEDWGSLEDNKVSDKQTKKEVELDSWKKEEPSDDDWGDSWNSDPIPIAQINQDDKASREEKRAQRRAEMAAKRQARKAAGPMKLGAKKM